MPGYVPEPVALVLRACRGVRPCRASWKDSGMPALEPAYMGLPPIVSAGSALVEAVQGGCTKVSPNDPVAIVSAMQQVLSCVPARKRKPDACCGRWRHAPRKSVSCNGEAIWATRA
ncbi:hypothetical protein [Sinorhizobium fredii]